MPEQSNDYRVVVFGAGGKYGITLTKRANNNVQKRYLSGFIAYVHQVHSKIIQRGIRIDIQVNLYVDLLGFHTWALDNIRLLNGSLMTVYPLARQTNISKLLFGQFSDHVTGH